MGIMEVVGPPKRQIEDIVWSEVLIREAVRGMTESRPRYSGDVGKSIAFFQHFLKREHIVSDSGLPFLRQGVADKAFTPQLFRYSTSLVETDPFLLDGFDLFAMLLHFDSDQAKDLNYVGFSRSASPVAHTIFALFKRGYRVDLETITTLKQIIGQHLKQAATHIAEVIDLDASQVLSILTERRDIWNAPRILAQITTEPTRIEELNFLFMVGDSIQVHPGTDAPRIGKMLAAYREEILLDPVLGPLARKLYAQKDGRNGSGTKMFNGRAVKYETSLFPLHPTVARELIRHIEAYDKNALIGHSVRMLAARGANHQVRPTPTPSRK